MYKIDLLKGHGLPVRSNFILAATAGFLFCVPALMLILMATTFAQSKIEIQINNRVLSIYENGFEKLKKRITQEEVLLERQKNLNDSLIEVKDVLERNLQWSNILKLVEQKLPPLLIVEKMEIKVRTKQKTVPQREDPEKKIKISVPVRTLTISLQGPTTSNTDKAVKQFQQALSSPSETTKGFRDVLIASRKPSKKGNAVSTCYEMNCSF